MGQSLAVQGRDRPAQFPADQRGFAGAERALMHHDLVEAAAVDELHDQTRGLVMLFGAVDFDRVRMSYTGQRLAGGQKRDSHLWCGRRRQEANDDVAVEMIGGADNTAERAWTERAKQAVRAPRAEIRFGYGWRFGIVCGGAQCARQRRVGTGCSSRARG